MLDATYSSTRRTIIYYCNIKYYDTIVWYIFNFLLFGFHFINNFGEIPFPKSLMSLFNCGVGIPFVCTPSKSFLVASNTCN